MDRRIILIGIPLLVFPCTAQGQAQPGTHGGAAGGVAAEGSGQTPRVNGGAAFSTGRPREMRAAAPGAGAEGILAAVIRSGLPESPVRRVIAQGRARGASAVEIERAAMTVRSRLEASSGALSSDARGGTASAAEIEAGAEALARGARTSDLMSLRDAAPSGRSLVVPLSVLAELSAGGAARARAAADLAARLRAGASDAAISRLGREAGSGATLPGGSRSATARANAAIGAGLVGRGLTGVAAGAGGIGILR